ncbi:MAG: methyltransferase [Elusimicrobia bacterium RIFOXYB2_FULL_49_7]|nr:MAG: methyltransferase [Elusimicrobia bacterium RIFOXYB2_FULL_49_7]
MADFAGMSAALQKGKAQEVARLVNEAIAEGIAPDKILQEGLISGMNIIAVKFRANEVFVPEVLIAARAMKAGMEPLAPVLTQCGIEPIGKVLVGTVKGDLHDIGKNLVIMMLKGAGFFVEDMGIDQSPENFVAKVKEKGYTLVGVSALLTTTMPALKSVIDKFNSEGLRDKVKIAVGGAPVTAEYAKEIGADGYADDAASAIDVFKGFLN